MKRIIITSGYFNPLHIGHLNLLKAAKNLGDILVVIVNSDMQAKLKGSVAFMPESERAEIVKSIKYVDEVFMSVDEDKSVCQSIEMLAKRFSKDELIFAKGGDRNWGNIPENKVCQELNIKVIDGVGGGKIQSSSWLLENISKK